MCPSEPGRIARQTGNFEPDPDELTAEVDQVKVTCP
jgi:hypothetical protein